MKKIIKSRLFIFILSAVIFSGLGTVFAFSFLAEEVGYTPIEATWDVDNVQDAIDDLYTNMHKIDLVYSYYADSYNDGTLTKEVSLHRGKYLLVVTKANSEGFSSTIGVTVTNATSVVPLVDRHTTAGETNVNLYHAIINMEESNTVTITVTQSIARGYTLKNINIYKI